jgi:hypothetical protein
MKRSLTSCAIVLGVLVLLPLGCHGPGNSPKAVVESALAAACDGDKAALEASFMPGLSSTHPGRVQDVVNLLDQKSLCTASWTVSSEQVGDSFLTSATVRFASPVSVSGSSYSRMQVVLLRDSAEGRKGAFGEHLPPGLPEPTGRWVVAGVVLRTR